MVSIIQRELPWPSLSITGDTPTGDRKKIVDKFNNEDDVRILVMTNAGAYGLNIQGASYIVHYDADWSVAKLEQREGRAHRVGQKKAVTVYHLIARNTIDEYVLKVLKGKQSMSDTVLGDGIDSAQLSLDDIQEILGEAV